MINSVQRLMGSTGFSGAADARDAAGGGAGRGHRIHGGLHPDGRGVLETAIIRISSNDPSAPFVDLAATGMQGTPTLATAIADSGDFGSVCFGSFNDEVLTINNSGTCPLLDHSTIISSSGRLPAPQPSRYPLLVSPGASIEVAIRFQPTSFGAKSATITLVSNDPARPADGRRIRRGAGAEAGPHDCRTAGASATVCVGSFKDEPLTLEQ